MSKMSKIIRYTVIKADTVEELITAVNDFINEEGEAWQASGNMTTNPYGSKFFQTLYRDI
jgi:hypothetical protein